MITEDVLNYLWQYIPQQGALWEQIDHTLDRLADALAVEGRLSGRARALATELDALTDCSDDGDVSVLRDAANGAILTRVRYALGGYPDSNLISLATTMRQRNQPPLDLGKSQNCPE